MADKENAAQRPWTLRWLASYPKSGNTWVRMFLNAYRYGVSDINADLMSIVSDVNPFLYQKVCASPLNETCMAERIGVRPAAVLNGITVGHSKTYGCLMKTHMSNISVEGIPLIPSILTDSALYLIRDPRDVAVSFAKHLAKPVGETIDLMIQKHTAIRLGSVPIESFLTSWDEHVKHWTSPNTPRSYPTHVVKYEEIKENPKEMWKFILESLGYEYDEAKADRAHEMTSFDNLKKQEEANGFRECTHGKFFNKGIVGGYKEELTLEQQAKIEDAFGEMMTQWGYLG